MSGKNKDVGKIIISKNGPYLVSGNLPLNKESVVSNENGEPDSWQKGEKYLTKEKYLLCRCGHSKNKPFCDTTHVRVGFDGAETAKHDKYLEQAERIIGPDLELTDNTRLCSGAGFCYAHGGTWSLTENSDNPKSKAEAIKQAGNCPSGRLVAWDKKTDQPIEPDFEPSVVIAEEPNRGVSGPIWVKGGVEIESANGLKYEKRHRVVLCRCGRSNNKPFCDGAHIDIGFDDEK